MTPQGNVLKYKLLLNNVLPSTWTPHGVLSKNWILISTSVSSTTSRIITPCSLQPSAACGVLETQICSITILTEKSSGHHFISLLLQSNNIKKKKNHYTTYTVSSKDTFNKWNIVLHVVCLIMYSQIWFWIESHLIDSEIVCTSGIVSSKSYPSKEVHEIDFWKKKKKKKAKPAHIWELPSIDSDIW